VASGFNRKGTPPADRKVVYLRGQADLKVGLYEHNDD
jgi:hypothetical protein